MKSCNLVLVLEDKMSDGRYSYISPICEEYYEEVIEHLRHSFFADEPLNQSVGLCEYGQQHKDLEDHSLVTLRDELSVMAVDTSTGKIIGVSLNGILTPKDVETASEKLSYVQDEKFRTIFTLLNRVNEELRIFEKYDVDKVFECRMLSVDHEYRGQGIAKELLKRSLSNAQYQGFKVFKQDATSFYTQKISENLGFETIYELEYSSYVGDDGQPIFTPPAPHECLKVMIKILD